MIRFVFVFSLFLSQHSLAQDWSKLWNGIGTRSQYTNHGLVRAINWNRAVYFGKPTVALAAIRERAKESPEDAQDLLVRLTHILEDQAPAGDYIVQLYRDLLTESQRQQPLLPTVLSQVLAKLNWNRIHGVNEYRSIRFDPIDQVILQYVGTDFVIPPAVLADNENSKSLEILLQILILSDSEASFERFSTWVNSIPSTNTDALIAVADTISPFMSYKRYFDRSTENLSSLGQAYVSLYKETLAKLPADQATEQAVQAIEALSVKNFSDYEYFQYIKAKPAIEFVWGLQDDEVTDRVIPALERVSALLERTNHAIPNVILAMISGTTGVDGSVTAAEIAEDQSVMDQTQEVSPIALTVANVILPAGEGIGATELLATIKRICNRAIKANDVNVMNSCANDFTKSLLTTLNDPGLSPDYRTLLETVGLSVFYDTIRYYRGELFEVKCNEEPTAQNETANVLSAAIPAQDISRSLSSYCGLISVSSPLTLQFRIL